MTKDSVEPFKAKEQTKASARPAPARSSARAASGEMQAQSSHDGAASSKPQRRSAPHLPRLRTASVQAIATDYRLAGFALAFLAGAAAALFLFSVVAFGYAGSYDGRVLPGVHVGSTDLSGLTRDQAIARLQGSFTYLGQGEVTITTPVGVTTITYQQAGRRPDVEAMADAAMAVGHSGNPLADAASVLHTGRLRPGHPDRWCRSIRLSLAQRIRQLVGTSSMPAQDAQATSKGGLNSRSRQSVRATAWMSRRDRGRDHRATHGGRRPGGSAGRRYVRRSGSAGQRSGCPGRDRPRPEDGSGRHPHLDEPPSTTPCPPSWTPQRWPISCRADESELDRLRHRARTATMGRPSIRPRCRATWRG